MVIVGGNFLIVVHDNQLFPICELRPYHVSLNRLSCHWRSRSERALRPHCGLWHVILISDTSKPTHAARSPSRRDRLAPLGRFGNCPIACRAMDCPAPAAGFRARRRSLDGVFFLHSGAGTSALGLIPIRVFRSNDATDAAVVNASSIQCRFRSHAISTARRLYRTLRQHRPHTACRHPLNAHLAQPNKG